MKWIEWKNDKTHKKKDRMERQQANIKQHWMERRAPHAHKYENATNQKPSES